MKPTMNMDAAAQTLNFQSHIKAAELESIIHNEYKHSKNCGQPHPLLPIAAILEKVSYKQYTNARICTHANE